MRTEILVSRGPGETRVAVLEEGALVEFDLERGDARSAVGNVYRGKVTRVLPGMQAAFVDIGLKRAAFLYVDDVAREGADVEPDEEEPSPKVDRPPIQELLRAGQEIVVQVRKAPLGSKGARVTNFVTIPGRHVVYLPTLDKVGVSRKITAEGERTRLKELLESQRKDGEGGFIARTVCEGVESEHIARDMDFVRGLWGKVMARAESRPTPSLLLADLDLVSRTARDLLTEDVELVCDDPDDADRVKGLMAAHGPELLPRIRLHEGPSPLLEARGVESSLEAAQARTVALKSGGSISIDEAEALTAIDINTGRYVGKKDLEQTLLRTNLEAAPVVAEQIRLRNLGGIIIVDFIDMQDPSSKTQVFEAFSAALERDRSKIKLLPMNDFGLLELTRKRVRPSLSSRLHESCPYCAGRGTVKSAQTLALQILRRLRDAGPGPGDVLVSAMPDVAKLLVASPELAAMEKELGRSIHVEARSDYHREVFHLTAR
ncbi:MAG: Rne/Rng family ribonuclease [Myxococcota bacterium]